MKEIPGFPNYRIARNGVVYSRYLPKVTRGTKRIGEDWRPLQSVICAATGYPLVTVVHEGIRKNKRVHRLLMEAFVPNPEGKLHINHLDGDKTNNSLDNLEWATPKENAQHAVRTGLCDARRKASEKAVKQICLTTGKTVAKYCSLHRAEVVTGVCWQNIYKVCRGLRRTAGGFAWEYV